MDFSFLLNKLCFVFLLIYNSYLFQLLSRANKFFNDVFGGSAQYERIKRALDKAKDQDEILLLQIQELETRPVWTSEHLDTNLSSDIVKLETAFATIKLAGLKVCFYFLLASKNYLFSSFLRILRCGRKTKNQMDLLGLFFHC